ncbi:MAG TPA: acyl transferase, partial [Bacteroidetes bacterium]|nr:acyl transferase [Bacteroidota bacterium]
MNTDVSHSIFDVNSESFERLALDVFRYQAVHNEVYAKFLSLLKINIAD